MQEVENQNDQVKLRRRSIVNSDPNNLPSSSLSNRSNQKTSGVHYLKSFMLNLMPHLAIFILFLVYSLIGAAIFKEVEIDRLTDDLRFQSSSGSSDSIKFKKVLKELDLRREIVFNIRKKEFDKNLDEINVLFKAHQESVNSNLNIHLFENNEAKLHNSTATERDDVSDTLQFLNSINIKSPNLRRSITTHLTEFKVQSQFSVNQSMQALIEMYNKEHKIFEKKIQELMKIQQTLYSNSMDLLQGQYNEFLDGKKVKKNVKENFFVNIEEDQSCVDERCLHEKKEHWKFLASFYFIVTSLTSIGYRGIIPQTIAGKLFTMVYLVIGLPLTLILLSDIGKLITRYLNFLGSLYTLLCHETYYDPMMKHFNKFRLPIIGVLYSVVFSRVKAPKPPHNHRVASQEHLKVREKETGTSEASAMTNSPPKSVKNLLQEIFFKSVQQSHDTFSFSFGLLAFIIFVYLTLGALVSARMSDISLFDGYYFTLFLLTKIDSGDPIIERTSSMVAICVYVLLGMSFFSLSIKYLQEKIRQVLLKNGRNIIVEATKFTNQFGYNLKTEDFNLSLSHDTSRIRIEKPKKHEVEELKVARKLSLIVPVQKCDKQTQITTLLYSKLKYDNRNVMTNPEKIVDETPSMKKPLTRSKFTFDSEKLLNSTSTPSNKRRAFIHSNILTK